jgi:hypothetical protein
MISATFQIVKVVNLAAIPTNFPGHVCYYAENTSKYYIWRNNLLEEIFFLAPGLYEPAIAPGTILQYWRGDKTWQILDKSAVGLTNVDNTSDINKPISTATQTALNGKADLDPATGKLTSSQIPSISLSEFCGALANVAAMTAPGLLTNNGNVPNIGDWCTRTDEQYSYILATFPHTVAANWVKVIAPFSPVLSVNGQIGNVILTKTDIGLGNVPDVDATNPANITQTTNYRFVTDLQINTWNAKQEALVSGVNIKTVNGETLLGSGNISTYSNTGNILYVTTTGSDTDVTRAGHLGSINKPFLTLEAARTAAISGDLIYVFAGNYTVTTTDADGLAKTGVNYYFEVNTVVSKSTAGPLFMNTASALGTNVYGYGTFVGSGSCTYIYRFYSSTDNLVFSAVKVTHSTYSIFRIEASASIHFNIDYCTATGGSCLEMNQNNNGATVVIDAIYWRSTAGNVISRANWWYYTTLTVKASIFESTTSYAIDGFTVSNTIDLNINKILGVTYAISTGDPSITTSLNINCEYCTGINHGNEITFNGLCGALTQAYSGDRSRFIGGSCNFITVSGGYVETNLGSYGNWAVNNPFITVTGGTVKIKNVIANYQFGFNSTGGRLYLEKIKGIPRNAVATMRTVDGGTVYIDDFIGCEAFTDSDYAAGIYLVSGSLYLQGKLEMPSSRPLTSCSQSSAATNLIRTNAVVWLGGNLIADGCTIKTADVNDQAIVCRGSSKSIQITSRGLTTNRPDNGGTFAAKKMKMLLNSMTSYTNAGFTLACNGISVNFTTTTAGKTLAMLATEFIGLINASTLPIVASTYPTNPDYWYIEATVPGAPITWNIYIASTGERGLNETSIVRDVSFTITNILGGFINENSNII